jgi:tripartite-type tricarboxylate transporter receptor subunit TctC
MFQAHRYMQQLTGVEEVKFDLRKFNWIGTMEKTEVMFFVRADTPYKSFDDVVKSSEALRCGATGSTDGTYLLANVLQSHVGDIAASLRARSGYRGYCMPSVMYWITYPAGSSM